MSGREAGEPTTGCGTLVTAVLIAAPMLAYQAWAFGYCGVRAWEWLATPHGAPKLGFGVFAAGQLLWSALTARYRPEVEDRREPLEKLVAIAMTFAWPWVALGAAWWLR